MSALGERARLQRVISDHTHRYGRANPDSPFCVLDNESNFYFTQSRYWELQDFRHQLEKQRRGRAPAIPKASFDPLVVQGTIPKDPNPKKAYGDAKVPLHLVHPIAIAHEAAAMHSGVVKYGRDNYLESKVEIMTYVGAMLRHIAQYASGERVDAKELVHHLGAVRACCNILLTAEVTGCLIDNRSHTPHEEEQPRDGMLPTTYAMGQRRAFAEVEKIVAHLNTLYPPKQ